MVANPDDVNAMIGPISAAAGPYARVLTWQSISQSLFEALEVERNVMFLILTLIILVAALNIVSGLIMLVKDKSGDIAILRTMGATRGAVMRVFLIAGASIGVIGTMLGFVIGVVVLRQHRNHSPVPLVADRHDLVQSGNLFSQPHAGGDGSGRGDRRRAHGAGTDVPRHALSVVARRAARSGRGAAL